MKQASSSINWQIHHQDLLGTDFNFQWKMESEITLTKTSNQKSPFQNEMGIFSYLSLNLSVAFLFS